MEHLLGQDWEIIPAGGATGEAFFAIKNDQKLFLKRNSSPFLAVLSAEGIVPKLIWTRRMENGDVITAQQCLAGREFTAGEMAGEEAPKLLRKIHESKPLLNMMERMEKTPYGPNSILQDLEATLDRAFYSFSTIREAIRFLKKELTSIACNEWAVCHGDVNHNNWLLTDQGEIFLIDWDGATIADPAFDLGVLLHWYVPKNKWSRWLHDYGSPLTENLERRMKWYTIAHTLLSIQWHEKKGHRREVNYWVKDLENFMQNDYACTYPLTRHL
ncbi:phosphotransferase family protein [Lederbergia sp. NSJ-179]|uniref:phosphotransferase family protein n=1 Tax=Lederbergia sp. NSJ-179 TaxID=2931402 RepID=UPI001FD4715C|nr:phosphotransferase family protein [Lederbergia sp. NSJ-179]MCJ7842770.1 phosphotransferase family protein [Lederbergia sp. NSJ-179]